ncbi:MAG: glycogen debranching enzyme GlgX, partial [Burkholderiaceae bacterium]
DAMVKRTRSRLQRALLTSALLSQGTPMLAAGDELGHTQGGNNNPYCQDNETTWIAWGRIDADLLAFTQRVLALRRQALPLGNRWYDGLADSQGLSDLTWLRADAEPLHGDEWRQPGQQALACLIGKPGRAAAPLLWLINGNATDVEFTLPPGAWQALLDTSHPQGLALGPGPGDAKVRVGPRGMLVLGAEGCKIEL